MSSMTTTDNKAFLNELARLVGSSHLLTDPAKRPAIARASVLVRATRWLSFSLAHY
ncbi:D-lactate dehydrogenase [Escherichia coli]|nr:D-lactate dehydrogenase [Escherichia coli]